MRTSTRIRPASLPALVLAVALLLVLPAAPRASAAPAGSPFGHFDGAQGQWGALRLWGWAIDPDTTASTYVWVTIDGAGRHLAADRARPDVAAAYPTHGPNHGFAATLAATPGNHRVCATAHNLGPGAHLPLGCRTVQVLAAGTPVGNFEDATGVVGGVEVKGWALDPDTAGPVYVWVTVDGVGRHLRADQSRPDVGAAYPGAGSAHGFRGAVPAAPGLHTVCVTVSNVGAGAHRALGCRYAVAGSATCPPFGTTDVQGTALPPGQQLSSIYGSTLHAGRQPCFDRVVLEFAGTGTQPGWFARQGPELYNSNIGAPVLPPLRGTSFIEVAFGAWDTGEPFGEPPSRPQQVLPAGYPALREVRLLGGFEGESEMGIGIDAPRPYLVTWLQDPWRLVVDVYTAIP
jgi:hypothetical protein